ILSSGYWGAQLAEISPGDSVAVIGAGPVGMCAMQSARLFGAGKVIALDLSQKRLDHAMAQGLCDDVILCGEGSVEQQIRSLTQGRGADAVIECAGNADSFQTAWQIARANAVVAIVAMYEQPQTLPLE